MTDYSEIQKQLSLDEQMNYLNELEEESKSILKEAEAFDRLSKTEDFKTVFGKEALQKLSYRYVTYLHTQPDEKQRKRTIEMLDGLSFMSHRFEVLKALKLQAEEKLQEISNVRHQITHPEEYENLNEE